MHYFFNNREEALEPNMLRKVIDISDTMAVSMIEKVIDENEVDGAFVLFMSRARREEDVESWLTLRS